jgi:hypothetical protein
MTDHIHVISSDIDGADLNRQMVKNQYYARCDGKEDNEQIQDALNQLNVKQYSIPGEAWERIFNG